MSKKFKGILPWLGTAILLTMLWQVTFICMEQLATCIYCHFDLKVAELQAQPATYWTYYFWFGGDSTMAPSGILLWAIILVGFILGRKYPTIKPTTVLILCSIIIQCIFMLSILILLNPIRPITRIVLGT